MGGRTGQVLAGAAAVLIALGVWSKSWWVADEGVITATVGLTQMRVCLGTHCESGPLADAPSTFRIFGLLAFSTGLLAAGVLAMVTLLALRGRLHPKFGRIASLAAGVFAAMALGAFFTFRESGVSMSWGFPVAIAGAVAGGLGGMALAVDVGGVFEGRQYVPLTPIPPGAEITARTPPAIAPARPSTARRAPSGPQSLKEAVKERHRPQQRMSSVGPAAADSAAAAVRFFAETLVIDGAGLNVTYRGGVTLALPWNQIVSIAARLLPVDPPYEKTLIVDLVPAAPSGARPVPVRLLASTKANYAALPGGAAVSSVENLRKLAAHARAMHAGAALDPESAAFFEQRRPAPSFSSEAQLEEYDRRYAT